jgi:uncharacterized membrane-anchored protein
MKTFLVPLFILALLLVGILFLFFTGPITTLDIIQLAVIVLILTGTAIFVLDRYRSYKQKEPAEDEYSKSLNQRASAVSFYISLFLWLAIMILSNRLSLCTESWITLGILGMALTNIVVWCYFRFRGLKSE